jgi:hypothetical protein
VRRAAKPIAAQLGDRSRRSDTVLGQRSAELLRRLIAARLADGALVDPGEVRARFVEHLAEHALELVAVGQTPRIRRDSHRAGWYGRLGSRSVLE